MRNWVEKRAWAEKWACVVVQGAIIGLVGRVGRG